MSQRPDTGTVSRRIQQARKLRRMTQAQLAEACGWEAPSRIGNYEHGTREPSISDIKLIADALWVSESWLLTGSTTPTAGGEYRVQDGVLCVERYPPGHANYAREPAWASHRPRLREMPGYFISPTMRRESVEAVSTEHKRLAAAIAEHGPRLPAPVAGSIATMIEAIVAAKITTSM